MKNVRLVIFDLDGTLVDAYPAINDSFNYTMRSLGYPRQSPKAIRMAVGWGDRNLLRPFLKRGEVDKALAIYRKHHRTALIRGARLLPGAGQLLSGLKKRSYKLAVASNRPTKFSMILIRHLGILKFFDYILCADKLKRGKPHPDIINKIRRKFAFSKTQVIYVGDMAIDVQAGVRAGVRTIAITGGSSILNDIKRQNPYCIVRSIKQLSRLLLSGKKQLTHR